MQRRRQPPDPGEAGADQFRLLVDAVKDYAIFLLDPDGRVVSWNAGAERINGYRAEEILGQHVARFYEPDDVAAGLPARMLARAAREGRFQARGWRVRKDGGRFHAQVTLTALVDDQGRLTGYAKITQDVTAEVEAERARKEREAQLAEAQAVAKLGSFEWSLAGDQVTWSPELYRILGVDPASYCGTLGGLLDLFHPDDRQEAAATLHRAATEGTSFRLQARVLRPTGELRVLSSWGDVTHDEQGRPARVLGVCQDVTDWRQREEALVEAQAQAELSRRLQSGLLPSLSLPDPALELRTRYRPGHERALLGADFFDALQLADGSVALLIGDVAGHGPAEAAVGVALRSAWRALVLTGHDPEDLLDGLDRVLACNRQSEELFATVCCCWIDPARERVTVALAGHPPPLLATAGKVEEVQVPAGPALGILEHGYPWEAGVLEVGEAWTLLCFTDGLVEGRSGGPGSVDRFGVDALVAGAAGLLEAGGGLDAVLDGLLDLVHEANGGELSDDVAILCLSRAPAARVELPYSPASVGAARRFIANRIAAWSFPEPAGAHLVLVASELVTNAVLHARTALTLTLELRDGRARVSVKDQSRARPTLRHYQPDALTGRGLGVVAALSERWGITAAPDGKVVWAEVGGAAAGLGAPAAAQLPPPPRPTAGPPDLTAGARTVRFPGVPVDGYLALQAHNDALFRELELISIELEAGGSGRVAPPLADLVGQLYSRFRGQRDSHRDAVAAALARGDRTVDLETTATAAGVRAAWSYLELLQRADELCRAGVLLTPEPSVEVKALRRWFVERMAAQP
jgi:PAS domain S-box-containing protein